MCGWWGVGREDGVWGGFVDRMLTLELLLLRV